MKFIPTSTRLYALLAITLFLSACQPKESNPDDLEVISKEVLKHKRGITIRIEPGKEEK